MLSERIFAPRILTLLAIAAATSGCLEQSSESGLLKQQTPPAVNQAPTISGVPATGVSMGEQYMFQPTASDPDGDVLTFDVTNRPSWATFDEDTGALSGTPSLGDAGVYSGISITVSDGSLSDSLSSFSITVDDGGQGGGNSAPTISGQPSTAVVVGAGYSFTPMASDSDGDTLTFDIQNMPGWANFDESSGALTGTPQDGDEGTYGGIVVSVSDGTDSASLSAFQIEVTATAMGSVTLSWTAPTENEDGSPLVDLAGYKIYYGTAPSDYTQSVRLDNPGMTSYVVENLSPNTYYFVATSFNTQGIESTNSNEAMRVVN